MLIERDEEIALLSRLVAADAPAGGRVVRIEGCVGVGKTVLLREVIARAGVQRLVASGSKVDRTTPLYVLCQLLASARVESDLTDTALAGSRPAVVGSEYTTDGPAVAALADDLVGRLSRLAEAEPMLLAVDDADLADVASLNCLLRLANVAELRLTIVLTLSTPTSVTHPLLQLEPLVSRSWHRLSLRGLSPHGVARLLQPDAVAWSATDYVDATGGNPRLVRALIEDRDAAATDAGEPGCGPGFRQAVATCLRRVDEDTADVAEAAAVLATSDSLGTADPTLLARMLDTDVAVVQAALATLDTIGITDRGGRSFRHPAGATAVIARMSRRRRVDLHHRAARQLRVRDSAVSPVRVAAHLAAAGATTCPSTVDVFVRAGRALTSARDFAAATRYLELGLAAEPDERAQAAIRMTLARTELRFDPASAKRHIGQLLDAFKNDQLDDRDSATLLSHLIWHGMTAEAANVIDWAGCGNVSHAMHEFGSYCRLLMTTTPDVVRTFEQPSLDALLNAPPAGAEAGLRTQVAGLRRQVLADGGNGNTTTGALRVLANLRLGDDTVETARAALEVLVFSGNAGVAAPACSQLLDEVVDRDVRLWASMFGSVRAEIALRHGHLHAAMNYARDALEAVPEHGWGATAGAALAAMIAAATALDDLGTAARYVQSPTPTALFESSYGAQYLFARGQYYLAAGQLEAAMIDFRFCGRLLRGWGMDAPAFVPWRSGVAAVHLVNDDLAEAEELITEQLELLGSGAASCPRTRGISLVQLSSVRSGADRVAIQRDAVKLLRGSGDVYLLSRAMIELSNAHTELGDRDKARVLKHSATKLSRTVRLDPRTSMQVTKNPGRATDGVDRRPAGKSRTGLSESEQRVAVLAATGHANREIAGLLYITVSTVEQHLTSVYRKLDVKRRADLPIELLLD
ncbi:helix-turn-helix transcriptional regulator [Actinophytocola sediminis]